MTKRELARITSVEPLRDFVLRFEFDDGTVGDLDLEPILWGPVFERHRQDPEFFRQVAVDPVTGTIFWPDETDLDPDVLYARVIGTYDDLMGKKRAFG